MDMTTTYDGTLLEHLAEHMMYLSAASSFWFNLNSSYDHDSHLSKRLGMSPQDYEYLLVAANLAQFYPKWGFSIKILKWKLFLEGHHFLTINCMGKMEVSSKKLDLNAYVNGTKPTKNMEKCHFNQIGVLYADSPRKIEMQKYSDGRLIVDPPRLNGLRIKQQSFRKLIEPFVWNYIIEKDLNEEDDSSINEDDSVQSLRKSPTSPPLSTAVSAAAITLVRASSLNDNDMSNLYNNLLSHTLGDNDGFFDPTNPLVDKSMRGLLKELI
jgi:hypothetical protein